MKNETRLIRLGLPVVGVVAALLLSGCTSEGNGGGSTSDQDLSAFQTVVDEAMQPWTEWNGPEETPAPPKDIELALVTCAGVVAGCVLPAEAAQEAAEALGWKTTMYDGQGDPVDGATVVFWLIDPSGTEGAAYQATREFSAESEADGLVNVQLLKSSRYGARLGSSSIEFETGDDDSFPIPEIVDGR